MLGRLEMSVDMTISRYGTLTGDVFSDKQVGRDGRFNTRKLEKVIKSIIKAETGQEDERMLVIGPDRKGCKT